MTRFRGKYVWALAAVLGGATHLYAQRAPEHPHVGYVFPGGAQRGTTIEVIVGGQYIKEANQVNISGGGIKVEIVGWYRPMTQGEYNAIQMKVRTKRDELEKTGRKGVTDEEIYKMVGITENELKEMEIYRKRRADPRRQPNVQISEELTVRLKIDADAPLGDRELRVITPTGMTNPLWFYVSQWPECRETEPNDIKPDNTLRSILPLVINGQINPGDIDRFAFSARKGQKLVLIGAARELIPYLADAVPGWFQAVLALYDAQGNEVAYAGAYHFRQDPLIYYEVPKDGEYIVEIHDSVYRGREDFVYRITIGELPIVTGIFPMGAKAGTVAPIELMGWNLTQTQINIKASPDRNRPVRWYEVPQGERLSVRFPLRVDTGSEILEQEPNDSLEAAQSAGSPVIINGRIQKPGDSDFFRLHASGKLVAEVFARRFGSPLDSTLTLYDSKGREVAFNDDHEDKRQAMITHHADSKLEAMVPGGGGILKITDAQRQGGPDFTYRLHLRGPKPDFELRVTPSSIIARPCGRVPITVHALRSEGHEEDVMVALVNPPKGFALEGFIIPGNQDKARMTMTVPTTPTSEPVQLEMEGYAAGKRGAVSRYVYPCESMTQAFAYQHLVPVKDWTVMVSGGAEGKVPLELPRIDRVRLQLGVPSPMPMLLPGKYPAPEEVRLELSEPPEGLTIDKVKTEGNVIVAMLATDAKKVKLGLRGNLLLKVFREWKPAPKDPKESPKEQKSYLGLMPAFPFEVVGKAPPKDKAAK